MKTGFEPKPYQTTYSYFCDYVDRRGDQSTMVVEFINRPLLEKDNQGFWTDFVKITAGTMSGDAKILLESHTSLKNLIDFLTHCYEENERQTK